MGGAANWNLIRSIQADTDLRLILPFGLNLRLGDVISVSKDGTFSLEGSSESRLGMPAGKPRPPGASGDLLHTSSDGSSYQLRAAGEASTLFQGLPAASAGCDLHFQSAQGWFLAVRGRQLHDLDEIDRFRRPILDSYKRNTWTPDWALVTGIASAASMTLLAARSARTDVALSLGAQVSPGAAPAAADFTAGVHVERTSQQITEWIQRLPGPVACSALRVHDRVWEVWKRPEVRSLGDVEDEVDLAALAPVEFWEPMDDLALRPGD